MNYRLYLMPFAKCTVQRRPFNFPDKKCDVQRILRESSPIWASEARRARTCEREWLRRGTICGGCGTFVVTVFTLCGVPRFPGGIENFMSDRCKLSFLSQPPRLRVSSRASIFHDIPKWRACLQAKYNVQTHTI